MKKSNKYVLTQPVYKNGTTLDQIVTDGWARGFRTCQTIEEARASGFVISKKELTTKWEIIETKYRKENAT